MARIFGENWHVVGLTPWRDPRWPSLCWAMIMEERQKKGIKDELGREASPLPPDQKQARTWNGNSDKANRITAQRSDLYIRSRN